MVFTFGLKDYGRNNGVVVRRGSTVHFKSKIVNLQLSYMYIEPYEQDKT